MVNLNVKYPFFYISLEKGYQKLLSGFFLLRGGGDPPFFQAFLDRIVFR